MCAVESFVCWRVLYGEFAEVCSTLSWSAWLRGNKELGEEGVSVSVFDICFQKKKKDPHSMDKPGERKNSFTMLGENLPLWKPNVYGMMRKLILGLVEELQLSVHFYIRILTSLHLWYQFHLHLLNHEGKVIRKCDELFFSFCFSFFFFCEIYDYLYILCAEPDESLRGIDPNEIGKTEVCQWCNL